MATNAFPFQDIPRYPIVDPKTGSLTERGFWIIYQLLQSAQSLEAVQVEEAFDATSESAGPLAADAQSSSATDAFGGGSSPALSLAQFTQRLLAATFDGAVPPERLETIRRSVEVSRDAQPSLAGSIRQIRGYAQDDAILALMAPDALPKASIILHGTHAVRLATPAIDGQAFWETDRTVLYISVNAAWTYAVGEMKCTQSSLPSDLGANDRYFMADVSDYGHILLWGSASGSYSAGWAFAPGDNGSDWFAFYRSSPGAAGWHICDGSTVNYLKSDGTLGSAVLPNVTGTGVYVKAETSYSPTVTAAVTPTLSGNTGVDSASATVQSGSGATVAAHTHTHPLSSGTVSIAGGDPVANLGAILYYRQ